MTTHKDAIIKRPTEQLAFAHVVKQADLVTRQQALEKKTAAELKARAERIEDQINDWQVCWDWKGPEVGGLITFANLIACDTNGQTYYVYTERAQVLELYADDQRALVLWTDKVHQGKPRPHRFLLDFDEIWPDIGPLIEARDKHHKQTKSERA